MVVRSSGFMDGGYQADQHEEQTFILGDGDVIAGKNNRVVWSEFAETNERRFDPQASIAHWCSVT